jgi:hypothetical protein
MFDWFFDWLAPPRVRRRARQMRAETKRLNERVAEADKLNREMFASWLRDAEIWQMPLVELFKRPR